MAVFLATISIFGVVVVSAFLVRNLIRRPSAIAEAKFPSYVRTSCNMSHAVCLYCMGAWGVAGLIAADFGIWQALMMSPLVFVFLLGFWASWLMKRQSPEIQEYARELGKNSLAGRFVDAHNRQG